MPTEAEALLSAEELVAALADDLKKLKQDIGSYADARTNLKETRTDVQALVARLSSIAERMAGTVDAIGRIATPEILSRIDSLKPLATDAAQAGGKTLVTVTEAAKQQKETAARLEEAVKSLGSFVRTEVLTKLLAAVAEANTQQSAGATQLDRQIEALKPLIEGATKALHGRLDGIDRTLAASRFRQSITVLLVILAAVLAGGALALAFPAVRQILGL